MCSSHDELKDLVRDVGVKGFSGGRPQSPWHDPGKHRNTNLSGKKGIEWKMIWFI